VEARREAFAKPAESAADPLAPAPSPPEGDEERDFGEGSSRGPSSPGGEGRGEGGAAADQPGDVDLSTLPDPATLGNDSDFTPFLRPGVPTSLRTAALRKLWTSDPDILNYRTLADYDWDFNAPGYGSLLPMDDVKRLVDLAIGEMRRTEPDPEPVPAAGTAASPTHTAVASDPSPPAEPALPSAEVVVVPAAAPDIGPVTAALPSAGEAPVAVPRKRRHGGAVPD
jgi:hypothetical protein